jgi:hypothetical protein
MAFNINNFRNRGIINGGARPSLFQIELGQLPPGLDTNASQRFTFTCRGSQIPPAIIDSVEVPYFGRKVKFAGDRTFPDWNVTVINDEDYTVRNMFESWSSLMNTYVSNLKVAPFTSYKTTAKVTHFGKSGYIIKEYTVDGIFPTSVDPMDLDWDATNTIQTFGVTFAYDYWVPYAYSTGTIAPTQAAADNPGTVSGATGGGGGGMAG